MTSEAFSTPTALHEDSIRQLLSQIIDPEVGASITDMGLVYAIRIAPELVEIDITMTSPACPMGGMILDDIEATLERYLPENVVRKIQVVWDPPWDPSRMSAALRTRFHLDS